MDFNLILSQLGIPANLTQDVVLLLVVTVVSLALGFLLGRAKLVSILLNTYISLALLMVVPGEYLTNYTQRLLFFLALIVILTLVSKRAFEIFISGRGYLWRVLVLSFLEVLMVLSVALSLVPSDAALAYVSLNAYTYLTLPIYHFVWLVLPLIFVLLIQKNLSQ